jgi:hypothetical protein
VAKPGAICPSEQAYWQVKGRLDLKVTDLGNTQLKNIAEPVHIYSLEVGEPIEARPASEASPGKPGAPRLSLVVLPFANAASMKSSCLPAETDKHRSGIEPRVFALQRPSCHYVSCSFFRLKPCLATARLSCPTLWIFAMPEAIPEHDWRIQDRRAWDDQAGVDRQV